MIGNVRETYKIPNAGTKECVQRMQYYPSGLPWEENMNSSEQPHKYNSKECLVMENENLSMPDAFDKVYNSRTYQNLLNPLSQLYYQSPGYVYACLTAEV